MEEDDEVENAYGPDDVERAFRPIDDVVLEIQHKQRLIEKYKTDMETRELVDNVMNGFLALFERASVILKNSDGKGSQQHIYREALKSLGLLTDDKRRYNHESLGYEYVDLIVGGYAVDPNMNFDFIKPISGDAAIKVLASRHKASEEAIYKRLSRIFKGWRKDGREAPKLPWKA